MPSNENYSLRIIRVYEGGELVGIDEQRIFDERGQYIFTTVVNGSEQNMRFDSVHEVDLFMSYFNFALASILARYHPNPEQLSTEHFSKMAPAA